MCSSDLDGRLGVVGYRTSAGRDGLLDGEGLVARICEHKFVTDGLVPSDVSEVVLGLLKGNDSLC